MLVFVKFTRSLYIYCINCFCKELQTVSTCKENCALTCNYRATWAGIYQRPWTRRLQSTCTQYGTLYRVHAPNRAHCTEYMHQIRHTVQSNATNKAHCTQYMHPTRHSVHSTCTQESTLHRLMAPITHPAQSAYTQHAPNKAQYTEYMRHPTRHPAQSTCGTQ